MQAQKWRVHIVWGSHTISYGVKPRRKETADGYQQNRECVQAGMKAES